MSQRGMQSEHRAGEWRNFFVDIQINNQRNVFQRNKNRFIAIIQIDGIFGVCWHRICNTVLYTLRFLLNRLQCSLIFYSGYWIYGSFCIRCIVVISKCLEYTQLSCIFAIPAYLLLVVSILFLFFQLFSRCMYAVERIQSILRSLPAIKGKKNSFRLCIPSFPSSKIVMIPFNWVVYFCKNEIHPKNYVYK